MGWSRLAVLALIMCIIFSVAIFGARMGYTVDGVPRGIGAEREPILEAGTELQVGDIPFFDYEPKVIIEENVEASAFGEVMGFYGNLMTFNVDGVPFELSLVFLFINILGACLLVSMFLPGGGG